MPFWRRFSLLARDTSPSPEFESQVQFTAHRSLLTATCMNRLLKSVLILALAATPLYATIFMRIKGGSKDNIIAAGATEVTRHEALVNGYRATLTILAFDETMESAIEQIRRTSPGVPPLKAGQSLDVSGAWISSTDSEKESELFLMPGLNDAGHCSAWLVEKDRNQTTPEPMPGINPLPDARLTSWIYDKTQKSLLSVHDSDSNPESAFAAALASMGKDGWILVSKGETTALLVKNDFPASITVYSSGTETRTAIIRHQ